MKCGECGNTLPPCDGFPKQVFCKRYHLHMGIYEDASRCREFERKPQTNADKIRAMTDEELAMAICTDFGGIPWCKNIPECQDSLCVGCVVKWLKQEVTE